MSPDIQKRFPGDPANPKQIRQLADEYRRAATLVSAVARRRQPLSLSPYRLLAIQAIELYLNAFLFHRGYSAIEVRRLQHNLAVRAELAVAAGLILRVRTMKHMTALSEGREYLTSRYAPEEARSGSQVNRLAATLDEVATKTLRHSNEASVGGKPRSMPKPTSRAQINLRIVDGPAYARAKG